MDISHHIANYWISIDNESIQCQLCPRNCKLKNGQKGFCFVRQNINGQLLLNAYGHSSGFAIDPIEKKPLNQFYPGSDTLSFGTTGCNLGCQFCQNWDISKSTELEKLSTKATPKDIAQMAKQKNCKSVAFTYNDPIIFTEYAIDTAIECHKLNIKTVAITAGYINDLPRKDFFHHMDGANIDLKSISNDFYRKFCNVEIRPILDTLIYLKNETDLWFEITNLLIPQENDSTDQISKLCDWVLKNLGDNIPIHFSAFHPAYKLLDHKRSEPQSIIDAREIALKKGIKYVYTGNIFDPKGSSTYCTTCKKKIIDRTGYTIKNIHISNNKCEFCGSLIEGRFDS